MLDNNRQGSGKIIILLIVMVVLMGTLAFVGMKSIDKRTGASEIEIISKLWTEGKYGELENSFVDEIGFEGMINQLDKELNTKEFEESTKNKLDKVYKNIDIHILDEFKAKEFGELDKLSLEHQEDNTLKVYRAEITYIDLNDLGNALRQTYRDAVAMGKVPEDMQKLYETDLKNINTYKKTEVIDVITIVQEGKMKIISKEGENINTFAVLLTSNLPRFLGDISNGVWGGNNVLPNETPTYDDQNVMLIRPENDPTRLEEGGDEPGAYNGVRSESVLTTDEFNFTSEGYDETLDNTSMDFEDPSMYFGD